MKPKFTPLLIACIGSILYGIYYGISGAGGNLGGLVVIIAVLIGIICLLLYLGLRKIFKTKIWTQVITELLLITTVLFIYHKRNGNLVLHVSPNFKGYIIVVYGVDKKQKLQTSGFLNANIDLTVPASGIIFTSDPRTKTIVVIDSAYGKIRSVKAGYGVPISDDTLNCGNKKYFLDVLRYNTLSVGMPYKADSVNRNQRKEMACKQLNE